MTTLQRPDAALLDVDGTLVDSNYLHVMAWLRACADVDRVVPAWRIHRAIGMGSSQLLTALFGDDAETVGEQAKTRHAEHYEGYGDLIRVLPGARELVARLSRDGVRVVLATSAPPSEFDRLRELLDLDDDLHAITTADDVEAAKPAPDIFTSALEKADVAVDRALVIGDAVWDVEAASAAGVGCVAVLTGGFGAAELEAAGAVAVFDGAAELLAAIDDDSQSWLRF